MLPVLMLVPLAPVTLLPHACCRHATRASADAATRLLLPLLLQLSRPRSGRLLMCVSLGCCMLKAVDMTQHAAMLGCLWADACMQLRLCMAPCCRLHHLMRGLASSAMQDVPLFLSPAAGPAQSSFHRFAQLAQIAMRCC